MTIPFKRIAITPEAFLAFLYLRGPSSSYSSAIDIVYQLPQPNGLDVPPLKYSGTLRTVGRSRSAVDREISPTCAAPSLSCRLWLCATYSLGVGPLLVKMSKNKCPCEKGARPSFGLPGGLAKTAKWCSKCPDKPHDAVDVRNKKCSCGKSFPTYGMPGGSPGSGRWCAKCPEKPADSVNVHSKRCMCGKSQPSLGLPGEHPREARWCAKCPGKPANAVYLRERASKRSAKGAGITVEA